MSNPTHEVMVHFGQRAIEKALTQFLQDSLPRSSQQRSSRRPQ